jgi:hypothetical protein
MITNNQECAVFSWPGDTEGDTKNRLALELLVGIVPPTIWRCDNVDNV